MATGLRKGLTSYGDAGFSLFLRKAFIKAMGFSDDALDRPIIGITNTASDFNPCHGNVPDLIEAAKRGVMLAGGLPMAFPTVSIHESFAHPTSMFLRNLMALDTEEMIRAQPMDAVMLIGGCDKTIPAQLMGAASANIPAIVLPTGPMLVGHYKGEVLGACTDCRRLWASYRAGTTSEADIEAVNGRLAPTRGTCMVMGTASTVACMTEAMGMALPGAGTVPATHADRIRAAEASGAAAIRLAARRHDARPDHDARGLPERADRAAGHRRFDQRADPFHRHRRPGSASTSTSTPSTGSVSRSPSSSTSSRRANHYMEHFHWAGGVPRLLRELAPLLDTTALSVAGGTIADVIAGAEDVPGQTVIRTRDAPISTGGGLAVLRGNPRPARRAC